MYMETSTFFQCCLFGGLGFFILVFIMGHQRMRQVEELMRQLAKRYGASFKRGNLIDYPYIAFHEGELELRLYAALGGRSDPSHTKLRLTLPDSAGLDPSSCLYLRPVSHGILPRLVIARGAKPYLSGEREFDAAFDVRGAPDTLLRRTLTTEMRRSLLELKPYRPAVGLRRQRRLLPTRPPAGEPFRLYWAPPGLKFTFYTAGLPPELVDWEPRLRAGRMLVANILNRPAPPVEEGGSVPLGGENP
jgi:hypothetical protein